jgi:hypothetical protein
MRAEYYASLRKNSNPICYAGRVSPGPGDLQGASRK